MDSLKSISRPALSQCAWNSGHERSMRLEQGIGYLSATGDNRFCHCYLGYDFEKWQSLRSSWAVLFMTRSLLMSTRNHQQGQINDQDRRDAMILLIDNCDSFTYNLAQYIGNFAEVRSRNDPVQALSSGESRCFGSFSGIQAGQQMQDGWKNLSAILLVSRYWGFAWDASHLPSIWRKLGLAPKVMAEQVFCALKISYL